jgi:hypothetical protein
LPKISIVRIPLRVFRFILAKVWFQACRGIKSRCHETSPEKELVFGFLDSASRVSSTAHPMSLAAMASDAEPSFSQERASWLKISSRLGGIAVALRGGGWAALSHFIAARELSAPFLANISA